MTKYTSIAAFVAAGALAGAAVVGIPTLAAADRSPEPTTNESAASSGGQHVQEMSDAMSEAMSEAMSDPEFQEQMTSAMSAMMADEDMREQMSSMMSEVMMGMDDEMGGMGGDDMGHSGTDDMEMGPGGEDGDPQGEPTPQDSSTP